MYPKLTVNLEHLRHNVKVVKDLCNQHGITKITAVTKVFRADPKIAQAYVDAGITMLGDSRVENLKKLDGIKAEKWLIRPPMLCELEGLVHYGDASLNSEWETICAIDKECAKQNRRHKIILMADLGDIREGYTDYDEMIEVAKKVEKLEHVDMYGIGVNLTCFSFIQPDSEKMKKLASLRKQVEDAIGRTIDVVSGGNSATIDLMLRDGIDPLVNDLRLGESLLFGKERVKYQFLENTYHDVFTLECQIVELKYKPSLPWGTVGVDSYGVRPTFTDRGPRRLKAVCALGKQDFDVETTKTVDPDIIVLGASSDHLMLDLTDSKNQYKLGDVIKLELGYFSTMRAFTSDYVEKVYIG